MISLFFCFTLSFSSPWKVHPFKYKCFYFIISEISSIARQRMTRSIRKMILLVLLNLFYAAQSDGQQTLLYDTIVIFGDSNSDNGNVYAISGKNFPGVPYFQGRFSNGPVWCERLNVSKVSNHAYGGATTDNDAIPSIALPSPFYVPGVRQQILNYSRSSNRSQINFDRTLYVIWVGGNNYLRNQTLSPFSITSSLVNATKDLLAFGIKHLILVNQPPLQSIPLLLLTKNQTTLADLTYQYNTNLSEHINVLRNDNKGTNIQLFDLNSLISKILRNSTSYGISNTNRPCWSTIDPNVCPNPDAYLFFDQVHFTSRVHQLIADDFRPFLRSSSVKMPFPFLLFSIFSLRFLLSPSF